MISLEGGMGRAPLSKAILPHTVGNCKKGEDITISRGWHNTLVLIAEQSSKREKHDLENKFIIG
jgi:hypothetical protein